MTYNTYTDKNSSKLQMASTAGAATKEKNPSARQVSADTINRIDKHKTVNAEESKRHSLNKEIGVSRLPAFIGLAQKKKIETIKINTAKKYPLAIAVIIMLSITAMFMYIVVSAVGVNELKMHSTEMNSELEALIKQYDELSLEIEKRDNLRFIEELAVNQYGMINKEYVTKHYINMQKEDKIEVIDGKESSVEQANGSNSDNPISESAVD